MKKLILILSVITIVVINSGQTEANIVNEKSFFHAPDCDSWSTYNIYTDFMTGQVFAQQTRSCEIYDSSGHLIATSVEHRTINLTNA